MRKTYDVQIPDLEFQARGWLLSCGGLSLLARPILWVAQQTNSPIVVGARGIPKKGVGLRIQVETACPGQACPESLTNHS